VYDKLHSALAEKIPKPDLLVYLRAGLDTLMARIDARDRPFERSMDRSYIESLRLAYDGFVAAYSDCAVLAIDTDELNIVQDAQALASVRERIRAALREGTFQQTLPEMSPTLSQIDRAVLGDRSDKLDQSNGQDRRDALEQFMALTQRIGELSAALSLNGDQVALRESLQACQRQLLHLADVVDVEL